MPSSRTAMRLVTYHQASGPPRIGVECGADSIVDIQAASEVLYGRAEQAFADMQALIDNGPGALDLVRTILERCTNGDAHSARRPYAQVQLLAPLPRPRSIRDFMGFEQHIINCIRQVGLKRLAPLDAWVERRFGRRFSLAHRLNGGFHERPAYYKGNPNSVVGPGAEVRVPRFGQNFDYELEFGIFIGRRGQNISAGRAMDHVFGYTIFNDFSARAIQMREQRSRLGPAKGKDFDTGNVLGPCIVTTDELTSPYDLNMFARVNGELWSEGNSRDMHWRFEDMIEYVSRDETLHPGEFFGSGTCSGPHGQGCGLEMGRFLQRGDEVELEVAGLGKLRNRVA